MQLAEIVHNDLLTGRFVIFVTFCRPQMFTLPRAPILLSRYHPLTMSDTTAARSPSDVSREKALSVFVDRVMNDTRAANTACKGKNTSYWFKMTCLQVKLKQELIAVIRTDSYVHKNEKHISYQLLNQVSIPLPQVDSLVVSLSGVETSMQLAGATLGVYMAGDTLKVVVRLSSDISIGGSLLVDNGEEIKAFVRKETSNIVYLPGIKTEEAPWNKFCFLADLIEVRKSAIEFLADVPLSRELRGLSLAFPENGDFATAASLHEILAGETRSIEHSRERYLKVQGFTNIDGALCATEIFGFSLETGKIEKVSLDSLGGGPFWYCDFAKGASRVQLEHFSGSWITVGGMTVARYCVIAPIAFHLVRCLESRNLKLQLLLFYGGPWNIQMKIALEFGTVTGLTCLHSLPEFFPRLMRTLFPNRPGLESWEPLDGGITAVLVSLRFDFDDVQSRLQVCGVDFC